MEKVLIQTSKGYSIYRNEKRHFASMPRYEAQDKTGKRVARGNSLTVVLKAVASLGPAKEPIQNGYEVENFEFGKAYEFGGYGVLYFVQRISDRTIFVTDEKPASKDVSGWNLYL